MSNARHPWHLPEGSGGAGDDKGGRSGCDTNVVAMHELHLIECCFGFRVVELIDDEEGLVQPKVQTLGAWRSPVAIPLEGSAVMSENPKDHDQEPKQYRRPNTWQWATTLIDRCFRGSGVCSA